MNELELYARSWGATAVPFGPLSELQWVSVPAQERATTLLNQTAALRGLPLGLDGLCLARRPRSFEQPAQIAGTVVRRRREIHVPQIIDTPATE